VSAQESNISQHSTPCINGIGIVFGQGRGIARLERALIRGWVPPELLDLSFFRATGFPIYQVPAEALNDKTFSRKIRRADRLSKMAVIAAADAMADSGIDLPDTARVGIIFATAFGPHATTFKFLDDIIDYGDKSVSPTSFSHSVHNAAASYVASVLDIRGPNLTVTHFHFAFQEAVRLAGTWLNEEKCDHVLVGTADECGTAMEFIASRKLHVALDGKMYPFQLRRMPSSVPGEGSVFFVLSAEPAGNSYCALEVDGSAPADIQVINADGMLPDESAYLNALLPHVPVSAYTPLSGSFMTASSFDCAASALMIRNRVTYPPPVTDNPHDLPLCGDSTPAPSRVACVKCGCGGKVMVMNLSG